MSITYHSNNIMLCKINYGWSNVTLLTADSRNTTDIANESQLQLAIQTSQSQLMCSVYFLLQEC